MLRQGGCGTLQNLAAEDQGVHDHVLGHSEPAEMIPIQNPVRRHDAPEVDDLLVVPPLFFIDVVGYDHIDRMRAGGLCPQSVEYESQGVGIDPVVGVHHFYIQALRL